MAQGDGKLTIRRQSLQDLAVEAILELVRERDLTDGDALPSTGELASLLDVSVPVIREALAALSALGLVQRAQGKGSVLSTPDASHLARLLRFRIANANVDDSAIQDFREIIEVGNARLAAIRRTPADLEELQEALARLRQVHTEADLHAADVAFHAAIARAGGNDLSILLDESLEPLLRRQRRRVWNGWVTGGGSLRPIVAAHAAILAEIIAGDADAAAAAMSCHMGQARQGLDIDPEPTPTALCNQNPRKRT